LVIAGVLLWAETASAEPDLLSPQDFSGLIDLRVAAADGEPTWLDGGFGKIEYDGHGGSFDGQARVAEADLAWKPRLTWDLSAVIEGEMQPDHESGPRLGQAFLLYKPTPLSDTRYQVRVGLFYPPISLEHQGVFWTPGATITPSAINSWVGEELKLVGAEASIRHDFGEQQIGLTGAVFGFDDNAGTLLATRGWSLDGVREAVNGGYMLPALSEFIEYVVPPQEDALTEIDHRLGAYGRLDWQAGDGLSLDAFAYENNGDQVSDYDQQWAWRTRFVDFGARYQIDPKTVLLSQALLGQTGFGDLGYDGDRWVNTGFSSAYVLVSRKLNDDAVTGRFDIFETKDLTDAYYGATQEHGWALTADYMRPLSKHATLVFEALHVWSERPAREQDVGDANTQAQTLMQAALRLSF
jgi:hypothetical protein